MISIAKVTSSLTALTNWVRQAFTTQSVRLLNVETNKLSFSEGNYNFTQTEVNAALLSVPDQSVIFASWYRFSHDDSLLYPAIPSETELWSYDAATGKITNSTNSLSFIGFISTKKYDKYEFEVKISSINWDDDDIGAIMAWHKDPITGVEHTLSVIRSPGGKSTLYNIVFDRWQGYNWRKVAEGASKVTWGNGASGALTLEQSGYVIDNPANGWGGQAARNNTDGSVKLWIERDGDIFKVWTSQWESPEVKDANTLLVVDLTSNENLQMFRGPKQYGLCAKSQQDSVWDIKSFTAPNDVLYDFPNKKVYKTINKNWVIDPTLSVNSVGKNVFLWNPVTNRLVFMVDPQTSIYWEIKKDPIA